MTDDEKYNHLKEIMDLKLENAEKALILQRESYEYRHRHLESKLDFISKMVYIGFGILLSIQFLFRYIK